MSTDIRDIRAHLSPIVVALQAARSSEDAEEQLHQLNQVTADLDTVPEAVAAVRAVLSSMAAFSDADVQLHGCSALHTLLQGTNEVANQVFPEAPQAVLKAMAKYPDDVDVQLWGARALRSMDLQSVTPGAVRSQAVATVLAAIQQHALAEFEVRSCLIDLLYILCSEYGQCDYTIGRMYSGNTHEACILAVADADILSTLIDFEFERESHTPCSLMDWLQVPVWHDLLAARPSAASRLGHAHLWFLCKQLCFNVAFGTREQLLRMLRFVTIDNSEDFVGEYGGSDDYSCGYEEEGFEEGQLVPEEPDSSNPPPDPSPPGSSSHQTHCALDSYYTHEEYKAIREDPDTGAMELDAPVHSVDDYEAEEDEDDSVELTAVVSREERDRAGRKRAIDLDEVPAAKRPCPAELETRVAMARSMCSAQSDARFREIFKARQHRGHARLHLSPALLNRRPAPRAQPAFSPYPNSPRSRTTPRIVSRRRSSRNGSGPRASRPTETTRCSSRWTRPSTRTLPPARRKRWLQTQRRRRRPSW